MAKLVSIGEDDDNVCGARSRGYTIRRSGTSVVIKYGPIEVRGAGGGRYFWIGAFPRIKVHRFRTARQAADFIKRQIRSKLKSYYEQLPGRVLIRSGRKK